MEDYSINTIDKNISDARVSNPPFRFPFEPKRSCFPLPGDLPEALTQSLQLVILSGLITRDKQLRAPDRTQNLLGSKTVSYH
ncbi:hypothetical protein CEXT_262341 [Caerostris extrusa]|uniref:Uncharacterized protein n=1 Tax=Caerostris extrusa TaxID=172846 RepID=A0AAV4QKE5_CAEEX|nr:hypothetical protein CEXT_262341 [Caerostris extrusa]